MTLELWNDRRTSGILLHPTSLPGPFGCGDLGPEAYRFVDWLVAAEQSLWQVLPLGPPDEEFSPYKSLSALAINPLLVSPERLLEEGLVEKRDVDSCRIDGSDGHCDFATATQRKTQLLRAAWKRARALPSTAPLRERFEEFVERESWWLDDHARFLALRDANGGLPWVEWRRLVTNSRRPSAEADTELRDEIEHHRFVQFLVTESWRELRAYANARGVAIVGDLPIYVSGESADVWAKRELFRLDRDGQAEQVAGVPPDYFSATGQLWGNPIYDWETHELHGYQWWIRRTENLLDQVDLARIDHFRGFQAYWSVPGRSATAEHGRWMRGPGEALFEAIHEALVEMGHISKDTPLPFIAEDLGFITPPVRKLRERFSMPGIAVLQFIAAGYERDLPSPDAIRVNSVAYTGTHDNDTTVGWLEKEIRPHARRLSRVESLLGSSDPKEVAWNLLELAWSSKARSAIAPVQDILSLGSEARMNLPGSTRDRHANWTWRMAAGALTDTLATRLASISTDSERSSPTRLPTR